MQHAFSCLLVLSGLLPFVSLFSQPLSDGPVIEGYGEVYRVENLSLALHPDKPYKVVFDITDSPDDPAQLTTGLNTLARFLNMHAQSGIRPDKLHVAAVLHGGATDDGLTNEAYRRRNGTDNPNLDLLRKLREAGVRLYVCGQSLQYSGFHPQDLDGPVGVALSAMTALVQLQEEGYQLIAW